MSEPLAVSAKEAARMLGYQSAAPIYRLIDEGVLPTVPHLKQKKIPVSAIKRLTNGERA